MIARDNLTALILVGGLGTRLKSVIADMPKPMAPINGRPFLEYQLDFLQKSGIRKVIFAVGYKAEIIEQYFGRCWNGISIAYSHEETALGTGGAMIMAARIIPVGGAVLVMNGDTYFPVEITKMLDHHNAGNASVSIAMFNSEEAGRYSSFSVAADMRIIRINDQESRLKSGGVYIFSPDIVDEFRMRPVQKISFERDITPALLEENKKMLAFVKPCIFIDIGVPDDYARASEIVGKSNDQT